MFVELRLAGLVEQEGALQFFLGLVELDEQLLVFVFRRFESTACLTLELLVLLGQFAELGLAVVGELGLLVAGGG
ncbi:hypothetical protein ACE0DR_24825 [Azotobacter sp. CWF10]